MRYKTIAIFVTDMLPEANKRLKETTLFENFDLYNRKLGMDFYHQYMQNTLQLNLGNKHFSEVSNLAGVSKTDWSWGALMLDMNNDGLEDVLVDVGENKPLHLYYQQAAGGFVLKKLLEIDSVGEKTGLLAVDLNGDNFKDLR